MTEEIAQGQDQKSHTPNPAEGGVKETALADVLAPSLYRLYRAIESEHWVLDPAGHPDHRISVTL